MLIIRVHHNVNYNNIKVEHNIHKFNFNLNIIILILMSPHNDAVFFLFCGTVAVLVCLPKSQIDLFRWLPGLVFLMPLFVR